MNFDQPDRLDVLPQQGLTAPPGTLAENLTTAFDVVHFNGGSGSNSNAFTMLEIWGPIVDLANENGGDFENPGMYLAGSLFDASSPRLYEKVSQDIYSWMAQNKDTLPPELQDITPDVINQRTKDFVQSKENELAELARTNPDLASAAARFIGSMGTAFGDPVTQATMPFGGWSKSLWKNVMQNAAINAGAGAITEVDVKKWYDELGLEYGYDDFLKNVAIQGAFGAALPVAGRGIQMTAAQAKKGWEVLSGKGRKPISPEDQALVDVVEAQEVVVATNPLETPQDPNVAEFEHQSRLTKAQAAIENNMAPNIAPEPNAPVKPAVEAQAADNLDGVLYTLDPEQIEVDAKTFQFKAGGDEFGVTERLQGVTVWDKYKAGMVTVYEYADGRLAIADGHQRLGLAKRIRSQDPSQEVKIIGYKLREVDGVSPEEARVIAAMKNIAEGTGTSIDAAKVLRVEPGRLSELPPRSELVRQARDMMALSDQAFGAIINEVIPANYGAIVGRLIDDPNLQDAAIQVLAKSEPSNAFQAESIVRQVREAGAEEVEQISLFGEELVTESYYVERAKVLDRAYKELRRDKAAFETLVRNSERLEAEGNVLVKEANERKANTDGQTIALLQTLANRKGPLSDALNQAARTARDTNSYVEATRGFLDAVRGSIESGDFDRISSGDIGRAVDGAPQIARSEIEKEPALEGFDEPTGIAAERQADQMFLDTYRDLDEAAPKIPQVLKAGEIDPDWKPYMSFQEGDTLVPVNKIRPVKVRPEGVKNAVPFMQQAARGEIDKRPAILVKENEDGSYSVRDGNSTYAIAAQAGWPEMPVRIVDDQEYATEQARKAVDRIFKQDTLGKTKRRFVVAKDLERPEFKVIQNRLSDRQPRNADKYMAMATKNHDDLNATAEAAAKELGMDFERAPVKLLEKINKKLARKGRAGQIHTIADAARTGITARTIEESDAFVAALAKKFHIIDEGWIITPAGYFDRKLIVVFDDGGLGEIQIWPPGMLDVKQNPTKFDKSGHDYYDIANDPNSSPDVVADANAKMVELYGLVQSELDPSFSQKLGFDAPSAESIGSTASVESSMVRSLESVALARSADPVQPRSGPDQVTALDPSMATISPSASLKNRNVPSYELTEAGDQLLIPGVEPITTQQLMRAASDEPMRGGEAAMPEGGLFDDDALSQIDISDITAGIKPEDFDMEIPVDMRVEGDVAVAEVKTLRDIKNVIEAEDAMIARLEFCTI